MVEGAEPKLTMADEHIQFRMGVDHANVAKGLNAAQRDVQKFVGKTRKDFEQVGKSFGEQFKQANRSLSQSVGLGIASLARRAVEDVWDFMTKKAADFLYTSRYDSARGSSIEQAHGEWKKARQEQLAAWAKEAQVAKDNIKREEMRVNIARERNRLEEAAGLKPGDEKAFAEMKIRHLKEDIKLARERMSILGTKQSPEERSLSLLNDAKQSLIIAEKQIALKREEESLRTKQLAQEKEILRLKLVRLLSDGPTSNGPTPGGGSKSIRQQMEEQQHALKRGMADRQFDIRKRMEGMFGDPAKAAYRDPNPQKTHAAAIESVVSKLDSILRQEGIVVIPPP